MKFYFNYQYLPKGAARPIDSGDAFEDVEDPRVLPNVGDYVEVPAWPGGDEGFAGKVKSRLFRHLRTPGATSCMINIVVEECDDDWGKLVKE